MTTVLQSRLKSKSYLSAGISASVFMLLLSGCMIAKGVVHTVGRGETFFAICNSYGVDAQEVAELNDIKDPETLSVGKKLFIPGVTKKKKISGHVVPASVERSKEGKIVVQKDRFIWPVAGNLESTFGIRNNSRHDGIDIAAPEGTPIKASDDGTVVYESSELRGYGNVIIIKHKDDFYTVYAHNKKNNVKMNDRVKKSDVIALVGSTGNATGSHLHFEVRQGKTVRNPLFYLP